jgi:CRISPR-associated RAMP protein (TIGR02581 family)
MEYDFDRIDVITTITGKLVNETPLRIGKGKSQNFTDVTDNPIITRDGKPFIPGSSIKGALRSLAEAYAASKGWKVIYPYDETSDEFKNLSDEEKDEEIKESITSMLFGSQRAASRIYVFDAMINPKSNYKKNLRTMISINRVFGSQQVGNLYTLDFIEPGAEFDFRMDIYNIDLRGEQDEGKKKAIEVITFLLKTLTKEGIMLGNRKSTGFGLVKLKNIEIISKRITNGELVEEKVTIEGINR